MNQLIDPEELEKRAYIYGPMLPAWGTSPYREVFLFCQVNLQGEYYRNHLSEEAIAVCIKLGL